MDAANATNADWLARARAANGSVIEEDQRVTFVWKGARPPKLLGDFNGWDVEHPLELTEAAPRVWIYTHEFHPEAYVEYCFWDGRKKYMLDPLNSRSVNKGGLGRNSFFYMPQARPPRWHVRQKGVARGSLTKHQMQPPQGVSLLGWPQRTVWLYQPPVDRPVPLVLVYDGPDYYRQAQLPTVVDNLIAAKRIAPIALAMPANGGMRRRLVEYACSDTVLMFFWQGIYPLATQHLHLLDPAQMPGAFGVLGASMGGLMALYTALRFPPVFGKALCQSGAYSLDGFDFVVHTLARGVAPVAKIWMDVGLYDLDGLLEASRRMRDVLQEKPYDLTYREFPAGHGYVAWRESLVDGLQTLFPPTQTD